MKYFLLSMALSAYSCSSPSSDQIQRVYKNKDIIINFYLSKSVMRSRGENVILFYTHSNTKTNKYFFEIDKNTYRLTNDSIGYHPDILKLQSERGTDLYKQELVSHIKKLLNKMDELNIRDISSDMAGIGIDLKIYMKSQGVILYVTDPQKLPSPRFKDYVNSMQKLGENWYYTMNEQ